MSKRVDWMPVVVYAVTVIGFAAITWALLEAPK